MILSSITHLMMYFVVAGSAQTHEVVIGVSAALGHGQYVMHLFSRSHPSFGITLLAIRVGGIVPVTDTFPCATVLTVDIRRTLIFIIFLPCLFAMLLAVLTVCQPWAARI